MSSITKNRITRFCRDIFDPLGGGGIGFVDVGSGGDLKAPWSLLPLERLTTFDFEPTQHNGANVPLCISNKTGTAPFFVARDERASSLHEPLADFIDRYAFDSMRTKETITVTCASLDEHFAGRYESVDAIDINVEGHDFQVLQGANKLLSAGAIKLLKVEFELAPVYEGQGYFADIDIFLRARDFRLARIQIDHVRPVRVTHLYHEGESIWGKALYAPTQAHLRKRFDRIRKSRDRAAARKELASAVALYAASELPGYVYDAIDHAEAISVITTSEGQHIKEQMDHVFRWAKVETGLSQLGRLASAVSGSFFRRK